MERRKLFSNFRRSLFSETPIITRRKLFSLHSLICQDCGYELETTGITTNLVCPNCGSRNRFNIKEEDKEGRRKLFSSLTNIQPNRDGEGQNNKYDSKRNFECRDCHTVFEDSSNIPQGVRCPNCGGNRVKMLEPVLPDSGEAEQHEYSDATDEFLKEYSGKSVNLQDLQKLFAERGIKESIETMCNSGYASLNDEDMVCFSEDADYTRRLFSELVISVTKELHLVPAEGKLEELINGLEERGNLSPKGIILVKKAHGMIPPVAIHQGDFSETDNYIADSGIANDLRVEYQDRNIPLKDFMEILNTQYNDAPDDILDKLVESGIIRISGSQVEILN